MMNRGAQKNWEHKRSRKSEKGTERHFKNRFHYDLVRTLHMYPISTDPATPSWRGTKAQLTLDTHIGPQRIQPYRCDPWNPRTSFRPLWTGDFNSGTTFVHDPHHNLDEVEVFGFLFLLWNKPVKIMSKGNSIQCPKTGLFTWNKGGLSNKHTLNPSNWKKLFLDKKNCQGPHIRGWRCGSRTKWVQDLKPRLHNGHDGVFRIFGSQQVGWIFCGPMCRIIIRKSVASGIQDVRLGSHFIFI